MLRTCRALLCATSFLPVLVAQQPAPTPAPLPAGHPPVAERPAPIPAPATQEPAPSPTPGQAGQEPAPPPPPAAGGNAAAPEAGADGARGDRRGGNRRRQGGPGGQGGEENQDLPAFTPVAAPSLEAMAGKQYFWFTMYPNFLAQYDPSTDTVTKKVEMKRGMFWSTHLTQDRKRMLVVTDQQQSIEVVDLASGVVIAEHPFKEEGLVLRIREVRECAGGVHWLVRTERVKKEIDRYSFEAPQWLLYDSSTQKVVRKIRKLPDMLERGAQLTADGTQWQGQDDEGNVLFFDARTGKETARIDLRTPRFFGAGAIRLAGTDLLDRRDPSRARMLFTSSDPVEKSRTVWGVVELDLASKKVLDVQEWGPNQNSWGLRVAPRKLVAAGMSGGFGGFGGGGDNKTRLTMYDLRTGQKIAEALEEFRPRRSLVAISPDGDKVYIGTAGSDFEVFDAQLKRLKTVELDGEIVGRIYTIDG